jgi:hypothetical protein
VGIREGKGEWPKGGRGEFKRGGQEKRRND